MSDADDYESLPDTTPLSVSALAGATAGIAEHCVMFPIDSAKTRMQSLICDRNHTTIRRVLSAMVQEEGMIRPMRGMSAMMLGAGPAHAMYFTALEKIREHLSNRNSVPLHLASGISAVAATMLHDAVMTPADVVKQRMQMCCSPFRSLTHATLSIYRSEGLYAFYRSYFTQLTMNVPFQAAVVTSYSLCQSILNPERHYNPTIHFVAGAIAGGVGSAVTMPLDVCKTLLNTQEAGVLRQLHQKEVTGLFRAACTIYQVAGFYGFFQGLTARVIYQAPSTAVSWSVYEFFKALLKERNSAIHGGGEGDEDNRRHEVTLSELTAAAAAPRPNLTPTVLAKSGHRSNHHDQSTPVNH